MLSSREINLALDPRPGSDEPLQRQPDERSSSWYGRDHRPANDRGTYVAARRDSPNPLVASLKRFGRFGPDEIRAIERIPVEGRGFQAGQMVMAEGNSADCICLIDRGVAARYKRLFGARRQILGYLIPGDICDIDLLVFNQPDYSVTALSDCFVVKIPIDIMNRTVAQFPMIERALSQAASINVTVLREWLSNVGQRNAYQRLSHFFCEMFVRLQAVGLADADGSLELPINQADLADTMGLTSVHISRTLQRLRSEQLIDLRRRHLIICDPRRLAEVAGFDASYLKVPRGND